RGARREAAYPGLRPFVQRFYAAIAGSAPPPIELPAAIAAATARDHVLASMATDQRRWPA
ncbi:MAG: hypothetical protein M3N26_05705, partial [Pseudomonadota bacterium]|nr:hypothetical protein [Pseudomonadota bacterium]